jgi:hypothetical protein
VAAAAASCWGQQQPSSSTTGVRQADAPASCHQFLPGSLGPGLPELGHTAARRRAWVSKTFTNFEGGAGWTLQGDWEPSPGEGGVWSFGKPSFRRVPQAGALGAGRTEKDEVMLCGETVEARRPGWRLAQPAT